MGGKYHSVFHLSGHLAERHTNPWNFYQITEIKLRTLTQNMTFHDKNQSRDYRIDVFLQKAIIKGENNLPFTVLLLSFYTHTHKQKKKIKLRPFWVFKRWMFRLPSLSNMRSVSFYFFFITMPKRNTIFFSKVCFQNYK